FKSFPVQEDEHFLTVCRYVERNALRAGLVRRAEGWRWGSLWRREHGDEKARALLSDWPVPRPEGWTGWVNEAQTEAELQALRRCVLRGCPYGSAVWVAEAAAPGAGGHAPAARPSTEESGWAGGKRVPTPFFFLAVPPLPPTTP